MKKIRIVLAVAALLAPGAALAAGDPDAARGIVQEYCVNCHEVPGYYAPSGQTAVNAPAFQEFADQPDVYSRDRLTGFLRKPHYPMAKFTLSADDIANLIAFIETLKKE